MLLSPKGTEEEDDIVPVFTTQVPECDHNRDQNLEPSEFETIEQYAVCFGSQVYVLSCTAYCCALDGAMGSGSVWLLFSPFLVKMLQALVH